MSMFRWRLSALKHPRTPAITCCVPLLVCSWCVLNPIERLYRMDGRNPLPEGRGSVSLVLLVELAVALEVFIATAILLELTLTVSLVRLASVTLTTREVVALLRLHTIRVLMVRVIE